MKKKTTYIFCMLAQLLCCGVLHAQLDMSLRNADPKLPTSQVYDFVRYGIVGASLYTGTVNYSLPVYTYQDNDFTIPISFDYASNGFRPNNRAGNLGMEWMLNVGGSITREIKGIPDEKNILYISPIGIGTALYGFYQIFSTSINLQDTENQIGYDEQGNPFFYKETGQGSSRMCYDSEPDIFHFNFMGHSGSFHLWHNGEIKMLNAGASSEAFKFEIIGTEMINITLTTEDGYKYQFLGNDYGEYVEIQKEGGITERTTVTWKLSAVIAPNNRQVQFIYQTPSSTADNITRYGTRSNYYQMICPLADTYPISSFDVPTTTSIRGNPLKRITITDGPAINFSHIVYNAANQMEKSYYNNNVQNATAPTPLISKIDVLNGGDTIKTCRLSYIFSQKNGSNTATGNTHPFLGRVFIKGEGAYNFEYHNRTNKDFPYFCSFSTDHWGYYNGRNDLYTPVSFVQQIRNGYNDTNHTEGTSAVKEPDAGFALMGMLQRINYPTGGSTELIYEAHDYAKEIVRNSGTQYLPVLQDIIGSSKITGGLRLKKIVNFMADGARRDSTSYTYIQNGKSSGILLHYPRYGVKYMANANTIPSPTPKYVEFYSSSSIYNYDKTHIEYTQVTEKRSDNSEITYSFSSSIATPDKMVYEGDFPVPTFLKQASEHYTFLNFNINGNASLVKNILTPGISMQELRGKLVMKEIKKDASNMVRKENWQYSVADKFTYQNPIVVGESYRLLGKEEFNALMSQQSSTDYNSSGVAIVQSTDMKYNRNRQLIRTARADSHGDSLITTYSYVSDLSPAPTSGIYKTMLDHNVIGYPLTETSYIIRAGVSTQIAGKRYTYVAPVAGKPALIRLSQLELWDPAAQIWRVDTNYSQYDNNGNLLEAEDSNGIKTTYIWGHKGLFPVAIAENLSLSEVKSIAGLSGISTTPLTENLSDTQVQSLKNTYPKANISLYKYKPFIGISTYIDPSGKEMRYDYNLSGKLRRVKDSKGTLHQELFYSPDNKQN